MRASRVGQALLTLGVVVGVGATVAWFTGFDPSTLPPAILKIAAYKLTALAAVGLMAAGAVALRAGRRGEEARATLREPEQPAELKSGDVSNLAQNAADRAKRVAEQDNA